MTRPYLSRLARCFYFYKVIYLTRYIGILLIALVGYSFGQSQGFNVESRHLTPEDGLLTRKVNYVLQDRNGIIWIGTAIGLQRYDGYRFENYTITGQNNYKIVGNHINHLMQDGQGRIWVSTNKGISIINSNSTEEHISYTPSEAFIKKHESVWGTNVRGCFQTIGGHVFVHVNHSLFKWNDQNQSLEAFFRLDAFRPRGSGTSIYEIIETESNFVIVSNVGLFTGSKDLANYMPRHKEGHGYFMIRENCNANKKEVIHWLHYKDSLFQLDQNNSNLSFKHLLAKPLYSGRRTHLTSIESGFIRTSKGAWQKYDVCRNELSDLDIPIPKDVWVNQLMCDQNNDVWVATDFGLYILRINENEIQRLLYSRDTGPNRGTYSIRAIQKINDSCVILSAQDHLWKKCNNEEPILLSDKTFKSVSFHFIPVGNDEFVAPNQHGFTHYKINDAGIQVINKGRSGNCTAAILQVDGNVLIGSNRGIINYNPNEQSIARIQVNGMEKKNLWYRAFLQDENRNLWLGTDKGLYCLDSTFTVIRKFDISTNPGLSSNTINDLFFDSHQQLWISTVGGGVNIFDFNENKIEVLDQMKGLANNVTYSVTERNGLYWIPTDHGLSIYNPETKFVRNLYTSDGLSHNEFNYPSHYQSEDGALYFGTLNGVTIIPPYFKVSQGLAPKLFLSNIQTGTTNRVLLPLENLEIVFKEKERFLSIDLGVTDYLNPGNHQYFYRLASKDSTWLYQNASGNLTFNSFEKRNLKLEIKGVNERGISSTTISLPIQYKPRFTSTVWFPLSITVGFAGILLLFYWNRLQSMKRIVSLRDKISDDLHDEVGSMLTQIAVQSEVAKDESFNMKDKEIMLSKIADTGREAISAMGDMVWAIDSKNDTVEDLQTRMQQVINNLLGSKNINATFVLSGIRPDKKIDLRTRQNIYLIFKEAVHNIAKHSNATQVEASLIQLNGKCTLTIQDNGNSFDISRIGQGKGWYTMQKRAKVLGGEIEYKTEKGIQILLKIPAL